MTDIKVSKLSNDITFGARITGVTWETLRDEAARAEINIPIFSRLPSLSGGESWCKFTTSQAEGSPRTPVAVPPRGL